MAPQKKTPVSNAKVSPVKSSNKVSTGRVSKRSSKTLVTFHDDPENILRKARKASPKSRSVPTKKPSVPKTPKTTSRRKSTSKKTKEPSTPSTAKPRRKPRSPSPISGPLYEYANFGAGYGGGSIPAGTDPEVIARTIRKNNRKRAHGKPKKYTPPHKEPTKTTYKPRKHKSAPTTPAARSRKSDSTRAASLPL